MMSKNHITVVAAAFLKVGGAPNEKRLSGWIFKDSRKLADIRLGKVDLATERMNDALTWFDANWPKGQPRPDLLDAYLAFPKTQKIAGAAA